MRIKVNDININYDVHGSTRGLPVVLIHGFPFNKIMWKSQIEVLKKDYFVVAYDVRGHGGSDVGDGQYTVEYFVDDLMVVLDRLNIGKAVVVGLSMGGYIALRAIERNPGRFRALVLCDTRSEADSNEARIKRGSQANEAKHDGVKRFAEGFLRGVFHEKTFLMKPQIIGLMQAVIEQTSPIAVAGTLIALAGRTDTTHVLPQITVPTLILVGEHDTLTPPSASQAMNERIPNAEMHVIPNAAHMSNLENPEEFNRHVLDFLGKLKQ